MVLMETSMESMWWGPRKSALGKIATYLLASGALFAVGPVGAEPVSSKAVGVVMVRPYLGGVVYLQVSDNTFCGTDTFTIDTTQQNGKETYAAVLVAVTTGKKLGLEALNSTGCNGWGTRLQSVFLYP